MAKAEDVASRVIREACEKHPDLPTMTLANIVYRGANKKLFTSIGAVRHRISYARGRKTGGNSDRRFVSKKAVPIKDTSGSSSVPYAYRAPKSHTQQYTEYVVHGAQRVLRLSDIHYPFHDERALEAAINYGIKKDPTILLLDGDIIDCHSISRYMKDPRERYTETEMRMVGQEIEQFKKLFPKARIIWKEGNHEQRLVTYLLTKAPELYGLPMLDIPGLVTMFNSPDTMTGVEWVNDNRVIRIGKLACLHGHEYRGGGGVNPARWLFLRTGESAIVGHFHRTSEHSEPNLSRDQMACWSTGGLCELQPGYQRHSKHNHGFAYIEVEDSGMFRVKNIRVLDGRIV